MFKEAELQHPEVLGEFASLTLIDPTTPPTYELKLPFVFVVQSERPTKVEFYNIKSGEGFTIEAQGDGRVYYWHMVKRAPYPEPRFPKGWNLESPVGTKLFYGTARDTDIDSEAKTLYISGSGKPLAWAVFVEPGEKWSLKAHFIDKDWNFIYKFGYQAELETIKKLALVNVPEEVIKYFKGRQT